MKKFLSKEVPQANDINRIFDILFSVQKGRVRYINIAHDLIQKKSKFVKKEYLEYYLPKNDIHVSFKRDVSYYKDAADILGFSEKNKGLTNLGNEIINLSEYDRRIALKDAILSSRIMTTFLDNRTFKKFRNKVYTSEEAFKVTGRKSGLDDQTVKRRMSSLEAWLEYCNIYQDIDLNSNIESKIILIEKDNQKLERAVEAHEELVRMMKNKLENKNAEVYEDNLVDLVFMGKEKIFFEMKSITEENKGNQLKKALGQLIFYNNYYRAKNTKLVVVLEKYFKEVDILIDDSIHVVWRNGSIFESDRKTKEKLKVLFNDKN